MKPVLAQDKYGLSSVGKRTESVRVSMEPVRAPDSYNLLNRDPVAFRSFIYGYPR